VSLSHANFHSTTGIHIFVSAELEDEGKFETLSASLPACTASCMIRRKPKLYSWMKFKENLSQMTKFLMFCNAIGIQP